MTNPTAIEADRQRRLAGWAPGPEQIRATAEAKYDAARNDADLTEDARLRRIAAAYFEAQDAMAALQQGTGVDNGAQLVKAKRALFGIDDLTGRMTPAESAATLMAFRDAQSRAVEVATSPQDAQALLDQAEATGDELLARAVGNIAINSGPLTGLEDVAAAYLAARPAKRAALDDVEKLSSAPLSAALFQYVVTTPSELSRLLPGQLSLLRSQVSN